MSPRLVLLFAGFLVAPALAGCVNTSEVPAAIGLDDAAPAPSLFSTPLALETSDDVSEPMIMVDSEGRIFISAPTGVPSSSPLFISEDNGTTFTRVEPNPTPLGGGDTSIAIGPHDEIYLTDLWAGSSTILSSADHGKTWFAMPAASQIPYHDREWNTVDSQGVAYYLGRTFTPGVAAWVSKSTDGGKTWIHAGNPWNQILPGDANQGRQDGNFFTNPKTDEIAVVYSCANMGVCLSRSSDQGTTWKPVVAAKGEGSIANIFPAATADVDGNWYVSWAETRGDDKVIRMAWSADGDTWSEPVDVASGAGNRVFPWMVAGDAGRVAIAWYETATPGDNNDAAAMKDASWSLVSAFSYDALGVAPTFTLHNVTTDALHVGSVSTGGTLGDADRSLGDFFTIALDIHGFVHYTFIESLDGKTVCMYARQTGGDSLYANGHKPGHEHEPPANATRALVGTLVDEPFA